MTFCIVYVERKLKEMKEMSAFDCWIAHHYGFQIGYKKGYNDSLHEIPYDLRIPPALSPTEKWETELHKAKCPDCDRLGYVTNIVPESETEC